MSPSHSGEQPPKFQTESELLVRMSIEMSYIRRDMDGISQEMKEFSKTLATRGTMEALSEQIKETFQNMEKRLRVLEDWRTGVNGQVRLAYVVAATISAAIGILGHFWK